jgi:transcriptional regulator with PAS, ATPase and Fis domain
MSNENLALEAVPLLWYQKYLNPKHSTLDYPILITGETGTCRDVLANVWG